MVIWWLCQCLPVRRAAVCLCDLSLCMRPDIIDGIFIWRLICLWRLILSCVLHWYKMYISVKTDDDAGNVSHLHALQTRVSALRERETNNEKRWHHWSNLSVALLSAKAPWRHATLEKWVNVNVKKDIHFVTKKQKDENTENAHCYFPPIDFLKHSCFLTAYPSQPAL